MISSKLCKKSASRSATDISVLLATSAQHLLQKDLAGYAAARILNVKEISGAQWTRLGGFICAPVLAVASRWRNGSVISRYFVNALSFSKHIEVRPVFVIRSACIVHDLVDWHL